MFRPRLPLPPLVTRQPLRKCIWAIRRGASATLAVCASAVTQHGARCPRVSCGTSTTPRGRVQRGDAHGRTQTRACLPRRVASLFLPTDPRAYPTPRAARVREALPAHSRCLAPHRAWPSSCPCHCAIQHKMRGTRMSAETTVRASVSRADTRADARHARGHAREADGRARSTHVSSGCAHGVSVVPFARAAFSSLRCRAEFVRRH